MVVAVYKLKGVAKEERERERESGCDMQACALRTFVVSARQDTQDTTNLVSCTAPVA